MTDSDPQHLICLDGTLLPIMSQKKRRPKRIRLSTMLCAKQLQVLWQAILRMQEFPKSQLKQQHPNIFFKRVAHELKSSTIELFGWYSIVSNNTGKKLSQLVSSYFKCSSCNNSKKSLGGQKEKKVYID